MSLVVRARVGALVTAVLVGTSACSGGSDPGSSTTERPSSEPTSTSASGTTSASGPGFRLADPGLVVPLPDGWRKDSLSELKTQLAAQARQSPPSVRGLILDLVHRIRRGIIVGEGTGPVGPGGYAPSVYVSVESGDTSLAAAATRRTHYLLQTDGTGVTWRLADRRPIDLPVGQAVRLTVKAPAPPGSGGVPSQTVEYVLLVDGSTVSVSGTAPTADQRFVHTVDGLAAGISRS